MRTRRSLYAPRPARVATSAGTNRPLALDGAPVSAVREEWLVEDRWWSERPIHRHYYELALTDGRCLVIFLERGRWFQQRA